MLATTADMVVSEMDSARLRESDPAATALARLRDTSDTFLALTDAHPEARAELLLEVGASLHRFSSALVACERAGVARALVLETIASVRRVFAGSPFVSRLQTWPRGYPGDFETVEWLCDAMNRAPVGSVAWAIEECALQSPVAQQHRNKVNLQARAIVLALVANPGARIASIGCGGCRDLASIQGWLPASRARFVLVDSDADALLFARQRLPAMASRCEWIAGRVPRVLSKVAKGDPFDLIVAGGLFDYLPDRWAQATLRAARTMLAPGGTLLFSNIATGNPYRPWLEYLGDWRLIERSRDHLEGLLANAGFAVDGIRISRDTSSLAFMIEALRSDPAPPLTVESDVPAVAQSW